MLETALPATPACRDRIEAEAARRLRGSSSYVMRTVACAFDEGVLRLRGQLPSFHHKQMAQELVQRIEGVERVQNEIEVGNSDPSTWIG